MKAIVEVLFLHGIDDCEREWWIQRAAVGGSTVLVKEVGGVWMIENKKGAEERYTKKKEEKQKYGKIKKE